MIWNQESDLDKNYFNSMTVFVLLFTPCQIKRKLKANKINRILIRKKIEIMSKEKS